MQGIYKTAVYEKCAVWSYTKHT